ncbi:hypothetical protein ACHAWF_017543 [Thalassiosira exigua]
MSPAKRLRTRALDDRAPAIFDASPPPASRDDGVGAAQRLFDEGAGPGSPRVPPQPRPEDWQRPPPQQPQSPPQQPAADSEPSSIPSSGPPLTILLSEAAVVTLIVATILVCCYRKHHRRLKRRRIAVSRQLQEWTTIRMGSDDPLLVVAAGGDGRIRMDSGLSGMISGREGLSGLSADAVSRGGPSGAGGLSVASGQDEPREEDAEPPQPLTLGGRLRAVPRAVASAAMYPLRLLEAGVNDWATEDYDEAFLRQFMERLEAEREAARENPDERKTRLEEAFVKECMVWELDEENFKSPALLFGGGDDEEDNVIKRLKDFAASSDHRDDEELNGSFLSLEEANQRCPEDLGGSNDDPLHPCEAPQDGVKDGGDQITEIILKGPPKPPGSSGRGEAERPQVEYRRQQNEPERHESAGEGQIEVDGSEGDKGDTDVTSEAKPNHASELPEEIDCGKDSGPSVSSDAVQQYCQEIAGESSPPTAQPSAADECTPSLPDAAGQPISGDRRISNAVEAQGQTATTNGSGSQARSTTPSPELTESPSSPEEVQADTPAVAEPVEDTFDEESSPSYLYLNRRRANTTGSISTSSQSAMPTAESSESLQSAATGDSHRISSQCAICLCDYEPGDVVVTSCDGECPHAFHRECIVEWLAKMQEGTPCPCCRRTFVELDDHVPRGRSNNLNNNNGGGAAAAAENDDRPAQDPEEAERLRRIQRRRHIELGIQRGRAFNTSIISIFPGANDAARTPEEAERRRQQRQEREQRSFQQGLRRGRAFNTSVISMR